MDLNPGTFTYEVRKLVDAGMAIEPNQMWTYHQMSDAAGTEIDGSTGSLQEALKRLSRDHGREFKNVRKIGYLRLCDEGIVTHAPTDRVSVKRKLDRAARRAGNIQNWEALADGLKREVDTHRSVLGVMRALLKPSSIKRVREEVNRASDEIDVEKTLALFRRGK